MTDLAERGLKVFAELMGDAAAEQLRLAMGDTGFGADVARLATEFAFGSVWSREGLERKQRSLVVIGALIAQRQNQELKNHIRIGLANGLTVKEVEEAIIQTAPYVGFPAVAGATGAILEVLREKGLDTETASAQERGLL